jgi:hypothetical protein
MKYIYLIILLFLFGIACNKDYSALEPLEGIDSRLLGDWIKTNQNSVQGNPTGYYRGIRILADGEVQRLAVQTSTGMIKSYEPPIKESYSIIKAINNYIEFKDDLSWMPITRICFGHFSINDTILHFEKDPNSEYFPVYGDYIKTIEGKKITKSIISDLVFLQNDNSLCNKKIWYYPSTYATNYVPYDSIKFQIISYLENNWKLIISLRDFNGIGRYVLDSLSVNEVIYTSTGGCELMEYHIEYSDSGFIQIVELDFQNNICSGEFSFTLNNQRQVFTEGYFRIPIY